MIVLGCDSINAIKLYNFIPYLCHSVGKSCNNSSFFHVVRWNTVQCQVLCYTIYYIF